MKAMQYTIRNIPPEIDRYLRRQSEVSGVSLNQTILNELSERAGTKAQSLADELNWFIGSGIDNETLKALADDDKIQKKFTQEEWK